MKHLPEFDRAVLSATLLQLLILLGGISANAVMLRTIGLGDFGRIQLLSAAVAILMIASTFGWPQLIMRSLASGNDESAWQYVGKAFLEVTATCVLVGIVAAFAARQLGNEAFYQVAVFILPLLLVRSLAALGSGILTGRRLVRLNQVAAGIGGPVVLMLCYWWLGDLARAQPIWIYVFCQAAVGAAVLGLSAWAMPPWPSLNMPRVARREMGNRVENVWLLLSSFSNTALVSTDSLMLGGLVGAQEVGAYNMAVSIISVVTVGIVAANAIYGPRIGTYYRDARLPEARHLFRRTQMLTGLISFAPFALIFAWPGEILEVVTGGYVPSRFGTVLIVLVSGQFVNALTGPVATSLFMAGKTKQFALGMVASACLNIMGNALLIPPLGALGASLSTATSIALTNGVQYFYARKLLLV